MPATRDYMPKAEPRGSSRSVRSARRADSPPCQPSARGSPQLILSHSNGTCRALSPPFSFSWHCISFTQPRKQVCRQHRSRRRSPRRVRTWYSPVEAGLGLAQVRPARPQEDRFRMPHTRPSAQLGSVCWYVLGELSPRCILIGAHAGLTLGSLALLTHILSFQLTRHQDI